MRLSLAPLLLLLAAPARAADISAYLMEQLKDFQTFQQSQVGANPELMKLVVEQVSADVEKEKLEAAAPAEPEFDMEKSTLETLERLAAAYSAKRRPTFLKLVSEEYMGDVGLLEDALRADFRVYRTIDLKLIPDKVSIEGDLANVDVHYLMRVTDASGASNLFEGNTQFGFRREGMRVLLFRMVQPLIFGTQLPPEQNPVASRQGLQPSAGGTAPGAVQDVVSGSGVLRAGSNGYKFDTQSETPESSSDIKMLFSGAIEITAINGTGIRGGLGSCTLKDVTSVPASGYGTSVPANTGECYAVRTGAGRYGVIRVSGVSSSNIRFDYKYNRKAGNPSF